MATVLMSDPSLPHVICLYGELGTGKTTFSQGFAEGLGILDRIMSPTYVLLKEYQWNPESTLYHIDLYRGVPTEIESGDLLHIPNSIFLIEWADKMVSSLPVPRIDIHFTAGVNNIHTLRIDTITKHI